MGMYKRQTNCPSRHKRGTWGVNNSKVLGSHRSDWHQLWFTSADSSGNGHRLNTSRPSIPQVAFRAGGGGVRVSQIQKCWEAVKRLDRLAPNLAHICRSIWEWIYAEQIAPRDTIGALGGGGVKIGGVTRKPLVDLTRVISCQINNFLAKFARPPSNFYEIWHTCR